jgi:protoheme ferro-lyase
MLQELQKKLRKKSQNKRCTNINTRLLKHFYTKTIYIEVILDTSIKDKLAKKDNNSICLEKIFDYIKQKVVNDSKKEVE